MAWKGKRQGKQPCCETAPGPRKEACRTGHHSLSTMGSGCRCRIRRHHAGGAVRQRLLDMGFVPNAEIEVVRVATLGDPMEIRVGDSFVTLRKREAEQIEVHGS
ncbi:MAG: ferrous iron transport protein A [Desulfovibrionales bacterium]